MQPPYSPHFQEHYWSASGGPAEKTHVFLNGNHLPERFSALAPGETFVVAELGFGTGLNAALTAHLWHQKAPPTAHLLYIAYEQFPLEPQTLAAIHGQFPPHLQPYCLPPETLSTATPSLTVHPQPSTAYRLFTGPAHQAIQSHPTPADAWFLDGFSPARNPEMWTPELLAAVARHTKPGGTCATYTVARSVREALSAAGFTVQKTAGFPPKRHMLQATLPPTL